ncbi:uncharacterized protein BJX67DRAFT_385560 [Aspergillus lucknowensis]|uniref:Uncharacterized protein n=1 Tax=Aspergillus lucknowensis TaxID=176173 RepID=A0ABR4LDC5_9EURO
MSLHRTLLYLLSLPSISFCSEQDILGSPNIGPPRADGVSPHDGVSLVTRTFYYGASNPSPTLTPAQDSLREENSTLGAIYYPPNEKQFHDTTNPSAQDWCSASEHCFPGDYCFYHDGDTRCCPEGLSCFQISGDVYSEQTVLWYEEVHIVEDESDEIVTSWNLESSVMVMKTRIAITASYPSEGRAIYSSMSESVVQAAETGLMLDDTPTRTRTEVQIPPVKPSPFGGLAGIQDQVVLG